MFIDNINDDLILFSGSHAYKNSLTLSIKSSNGNMIYKSSIVLQLTESKK